MSEIALKQAFKQTGVILLNPHEKSLWYNKTQARMHEQLTAQEQLKDIETL